MKEVNFQDRVPTYPGRVYLTPVPEQENTFDMVRADEPDAEGTPLDKAMFNSIIHSRLTGRYYSPELSRELYTTRSGVTTSPLPTSGWIYATDNNNKATSGIYAIETSSNNGSDWLAGFAFTSNGWQSMGGDSSWIQIHHLQPIKVINIRFGVEFQYGGRFSKLEIQGSNNGTTWTTLGELTSISGTSAVEYALGAPGEYSYYRLYFTNTDSNRVKVKSLSYTLYDVNTYTNSFSLSDELPAEWTEGQRVMIATPDDVSSFAVLNNTLNGVAVNTILQKSARYELRYNGNSFDVKEV